MGWDRPLGYYFMVISLTNTDGEPIYDEPIYSNLDDDNASMSATPSYFVEKARLFGIEIPKEMIARLQKDKLLNLGNEESVFNEDGREILEVT